MNNSSKIPISLIPHCVSSLPSPQSSLKSQILFTSTHTWLEHVNVFGGHDSWGSKGTKLRGLVQQTNIFLLYHHPCCEAVSCKSFEILIWIVPGREHLWKAMSSIAMSPSSLKVLVASKMIVKTWWVRPIATSARCHVSPWSPDFHQIGVFLRPSWRNTCNSPIPANTRIYNQSIPTRKQLYYCSPLNYTNFYPIFKMIFIDKNQRK